MAERTRYIRYKEPGYHDGLLAAPAVQGSQWTRSFEHEIHLLRDKTRKGPVPFDIGGVFETQKQIYLHDQLNVDLTYVNPTYGPSRYVGPVSVTESVAARWTDTDHWRQSNNSEMDAFGTTAIARTIPTAPSADLSVFLGELLREGVPKAVGAAMLKNKFRDYRDVGREYLNVQFGWMPFVSELQAISSAIATQEQRFAQLTRDSGKNVRRRFDFPIVRRSEGPFEQGGRYPWPTLNRRYYNGFASTYRTNTFYQRRWFTGCFTYNFALSNTQAGRAGDQAKKARLLLGLDLSPAVVWNLAPWSWLADWVSNTGDILTNVSAFNRDDLVLRHGYIMEETIRDAIHGGRKLELKNYEQVVNRIPLMEDHYVIHYKQRKKATPYGFGLDTGGFSPRQWAVLGALGISRGPSKL